MMKEPTHPLRRSSFLVRYSAVPLFPTEIGRLARASSADSVQARRMTSCQRNCPTARQEMSGWHRHGKGVLGATASFGYGLLGPNTSICSRVSTVANDSLITPSRPPQGRCPSSSRWRTKNG